MRLLQALPSQRLLHLRLPADLALWYPDAGHLGASAVGCATAGRPHWLHNDCFPASPDDVGTYFAETAAQLQALRAYAQQASAVTGAGARPSEPPEPAQARMACADILREGGTT